MTLAEAGGTVIFAVAALVWIVAVTAALGAMRHRLPDRSRLWYATHSHAFFSGERHFLPAAAPYLRRFRIAALLFLLAIVIGAAAVLVFAKP